jgi:hypothetical protein
MDFASRDFNPSTTSIYVSEAEARRLTESEHDLEGHLASARIELEKATALRQALLSEGETTRNERAIATAEADVKDAQAVVCNLQDALSSVRHERELAQQGLEAALDYARRLDESASIALVICELVDALKVFDRASDRLASALDGACTRAAHAAPFVAASVRIGTTRLAMEARDILGEIEAYRAGLLDGSAKLLEPDTAKAGDVEPELPRAVQFVTAEPALSIFPATVPSPRPADAGSGRCIS